MDLPLLVSLIVVVPLFILTLAGASLFFLFLSRRSRSNLTVAGDIERGGGGKIVDVPDEDSAGRKFTWSELESFTCRFTSKLVGEGGYSTVYLAELSGGTAAAVKVYCSDSERVHRVFRQELDLLLRLRHPHLVLLLGFCDEREKGALVLEYVAGGNLHEKLHSVDVNSPVLTWTRRTAVAYQLAKALEYLHETCNPFVVHGDIKSANILVDANADVIKLCDFGSAYVGFSSMVKPPAAAATVMTGSLGYVDPHYLHTGVLSKKSDVYSFGVLLIELITGLEAFSKEKQRPLATFVRETLKSDKLNYFEFVDMKMEANYDAGEVAELVALAAKCVCEQPSLRPSMAEVVQVMEEKIPRVNSQSKKDEL